MRQRDRHGKQPVQAAGGADARGGSAGGAAGSRATPGSPGDLLRGMAAGCVLLLGVGAIVWLSRGGGASLASLGGGTESKQGTGGPRVFTPAELQGVGAPALREVFLGADFDADDLLAVQEPVLVRGFDPATLAAAKHHWSPEKLRQTQLFSATASMTGGRKSQTRVMRYREQLEPALDSRFGFEWPAHKYDNWDFHSATLDNTLDPPKRGAYEMFAKSVADLGQAGVHQEGVGALYELIQPVCPFGCPKNIKKMGTIWMQGRGLGQHLHFDIGANVFFHLAGRKTVILLPPEHVMNSTHLMPSIHPAGRQSQLAWSSSESDRTVTGFSTAKQSELVPVPYPYDVERRVTLKPGDVLLIPSCWGHQTFTPKRYGASVSFAMNFLPAVHPDTLPGGKAPPMLKETLNAAVTAILTHSDILSKPAGSWSLLRELGRSVIRDLWPDEHEQSAFLREWHSQRWAPQYSSLGADPDWPLPTAVCQAPPAAAKEALAEATALLSAHCHNWGAQLGAGAAGPYMRYEAGSVLDFMPTSVLRSMHKALSSSVAEGAGTKSAWEIGTTVDIETEDGWERGATILGPAGSGNDAEMSIRFADGVIDDWDVAEFRAAGPAPSLSDTLVLLVRSIVECSD